MTVAQQPAAAPATERPLPEALPAGERLLLAQKAFRNIQFGRLRGLLEPLFSPEVIISRGQGRLEARALLGTGLFFEAGGDDPEADAALRGAAEAQFLALLRESPDYELDPLAYPTSVVEFFELTKQKHAPELEARRGASQDQVPPSAGLTSIYIERVVRRRNWGLNFMPFGVGQFQNGDDIKGTLLGAGQAAALTTNVAAFVWAQSIWRDVGGVFPRDATGSRPGSQAQTVENLEAAMYISLGVFAALYAWSVADGLLLYEEEDVLLRTLDGPPQELLPQSGAWSLGGTWFF